MSTREGMWPKKAIDWIKDGTAFVSVPFTWNLPQVYSRCVFLREQGYRVRAGGPAASLIPDYLAGVAEIGGKVNALRHHNPDATFTSRGCVRKCSFCAVPRIEPDFVELDEWEPKPIICDNNLLACSRSHFDKVIDSLRGLKGIDFNQGLDARLLTDYHIGRITELDFSLIRLAWDDIGLERQIMRSIERLNRAGVHKKKIRVYVLMGYEDTPEDARYRLDTLRNLGIFPNPQRYQPLDALVKNGYVNEANGWTDRLLRKYVNYYSRLIWHGHVPLEEFDETR